MEGPKISVIIPVYNVEDYLQKCIDSVINQTYKNIEVILVNDGSSDNSPQICDDYAEMDKRILVIHKENGGISSARNTGIKKAQCEFILFVDSDDWIELNTCEVAIDLVKNNSVDVVLWPFIRELSHQSKKKSIFEDKLAEFHVEEAQQILYRRMIGLLDHELAAPENADAIVTVWGKLYNANIIKKHNIKFIDTKLIGSSEDALFNLEVFQFVKKAIYIDRYLYHYRKDNGSSFTKQYRPKLYEQWNYLFDLMQQHIVENRLGKVYKQALNNRVAMSIIGLGFNELNSKDSIYVKIKRIKSIIASEHYRNAYKMFELKYLPFHWKVFFLFAKMNQATAIYTLLQIIGILRRM